jgi:hypothetical protein
MCEHCKELDGKIQRYPRFVVQGLDALTIEHINELIQELQQRKEALRCSANSGSKG